MRPDGRQAHELRPLVLERGANPYAEGSCLVRMGGTLVLCTASVEAGVPGWRKGSGKGWVTAEYAMLPRATQQRTPRERNGAGGRTHEIQRLIGRSLRAAITGFAFGEYTAQRIPGAQFMPLMTGGHLLLGHHAEVRARVNAFLRQYAAAVKQ